MKHEIEKDWYHCTESQRHQIPAIRWKYRLWLVIQILLLSGKKQTLNNFLLKQLNKLADLRVYKSGAFYFIDGFYIEKALSVLEEDHKHEFGSVEEVDEHFTFVPSEKEGLCRTCSEAA